MRYSHHAILLLLPLILQNRSFAADETDRQVWLDFYPHFYLSENVEYYGDAGIRIQVSDFSCAQVPMRPSGVAMYMMDPFQHTAPKHSL
jgi:hypothetical protein